MSVQFILQNAKCKVTIKEIQYGDLKAGTYQQILNPANYTDGELTKVFSVFIDLYDHDIILDTCNDWFSFIKS